MGPIALRGAATLSKLRALVGAPDDAHSAEFQATHGDLQLNSFEAVERDRAGWWWFLTRPGPGDLVYVVKLGFARGSRQNREHDVEVALRIISHGAAPLEVPS